jgi:hypothetical protein
MITSRLYTPARQVSRYRLIQAGDRDWLVECAGRTQTGGAGMHKTESSECRRPRTLRRYRGHRNIPSHLSAYLLVVFITFRPGGAVRDLTGIPY